MKDNLVHKKSNNWLIFNNKRKKKENFYNIIFKDFKALH